jgi:hypothetical protein
VHSFDCFGLRNLLSVANDDHVPADYLLRQITLFRSVLCDDLGVQLVSRHDDERGGRRRCVT